MTQDQEQRIASLLGRLYDRWQDEREYEDFEEYIGALVEALPAGITLVSLRSEPFAAVIREQDKEFMFSVGDGTVIIYRRARLH